MSRSYDVIVVGLGAMGSAALRALARRGLAVLGLDRFAPPHDRGSSHGDSRIIREAYFEDPAYVPLVQRAFLLWEELERESRRTLLTRTGGLMIGPRDGVLVSGALRSAVTHGLPHELLDAAAIRARVPAFRPADDWVAVWEPNDGVLRPEAGVQAMLDSARAHRATMRTGEPATAWSAGPHGVTVTTPRGRYASDRVVLAAGAWLGRLVPELPLMVTRQVQYWFETIGARTAHDSGFCPISIWEIGAVEGHGRGSRAASAEANSEAADAPPFFYGFPRSDRGVKVAFHGVGEAVDPQAPLAPASPAEVARIRAVVQQYMPFASGPLLASVPCLYTNTPDGHFVIGEHPAHARVTIVSACSGHGFKFAPAIGEIVADRIADGWTRHDLGLFGIDRLRTRRPA